MRWQEELTSRFIFQIEQIEEEDGVITCSRGAAIASASGELGGGRRAARGGLQDEGRNTAAGRMA
jgi:hypothetical protein